MQSIRVEEDEFPVSAGTVRELVNAIHGLADANLAIAGALRSFVDAHGVPAEFRQMLMDGLQTAETELSKAETAMRAAREDVT